MLKAVNSHVLVWENGAFPEVLKGSIVSSMIYNSGDTELLRNYGPMVITHQASLG